MDWSRRDLLFRGGGIGGLALAWLMEREARAASPLAARRPHFEPKVRRVIQVFCMGGVSHVDTFDYKPALEKFDGKPMPGGGKIETFFGVPGNLLKSQFAFRQRGASGLWVSDLLPHIAGCADDLTVIRSMAARSANHAPAAFQINTGFILNGFPSMGAWITYGLGSENQDLPAFVVLPDPRAMPWGGSLQWSAGFLPAAFQGTMFRPSGDPVPDLATPADVSAQQRGTALEWLAAMNSRFRHDHPGDSAVEARIRSYELAARMQLSVPEATDLKGETEATRRLYGLDDKETQGFGRNCLIARRLVERGVRFVQLYHGGGAQNWDAHGDVIENHKQRAPSMDRPVAALLRDLKSRGLLDDTLLLWTTEFGRTPFSQGYGKTGRDHHPEVFTCWMAGGGLRPGLAFGASDDLGYRPAGESVTIYDLHATILHLLGLNHEDLTYYHNGIRRRLTDVHGHVVRGILS